MMHDRLLIPTFLCPRPWESMRGDELTRFCTYCRKEVHNLAHPDSPTRATLQQGAAAGLCGRYQAAIRRARPTHRDSYRRHLLKYGTGVAVAGSALVVLWEWSSRDGRTCLRVGGGADMPASWYDESRPVLMGEIATRGEPPPEDAAADDSSEEPVAPVPSLEIPTEEMDRLFGEPARPGVILTPIEPVALPPRS